MDIIYGAADVIVVGKPNPLIFDVQKKRDILSYSLAEQTVKIYPKHSGDEYRTFLSFTFFKASPLRSISHRQPVASI